MLVKLVQIRVNPFEQCCEALLGWFQHGLRGVNLEAPKRPIEIVPGVYPVFGFSK